MTLRLTRSADSFRRSCCRQRPPRRRTAAAAPGRKPRVSPPQPQQAQGPGYFTGAWSFIWVGRESPVSAGPREGTLTYLRRDANALELRAEGRIDGGSAFTESATAVWNEEAKTLTWTRAVGTGLELRLVGDWSSPIGIRAESDPVQAGTQTIRVRRLYSILSPHAYMVTEEISVNDGPYQRLGSGRFQRH